MQHKQTCSKRQLQSLLGQLLYVHMLQLLRDNYDRSVDHLNVSFRQDLNWFYKFLSKYIGTYIFNIQIHMTWLNWKHV